MRKLYIVAMLLALVGLFSQVSAAPNSVSIGLDRAFLYNNGVLQIPVYVTNVVPTSGFGWPIKVSTSGQPLYPDSLTPSGRVNAQFVVGRLNLFSEILVPTSMDSICFSVVTGASPNKTVPAGSGIAGTAWLHGGAVGDHLHIEQFADGDTLSFGSTGCYFDSVHMVTGGPSAVYMPADFLSSELIIVPAPVEMLSPDTVFGQTGLPIVTNVNIAGYGTTFSLGVVSFSSASGPLPQPTISGSNPFVVSWTPTMVQSGVLTLVLKGSDFYGQTMDKTIIYNISKSAIQGDVNCDAVVDLTDLARLVAFLTGNGPTPVCPGK